MKYNKLVRDNIIEIINSHGKSCKSHRASDKEYHQALREKLIEEVNEFLTDESIEELADILEVIHAIADEHFGGYAELEKKRLEKKSKRGGFAKRIILESTE